MQLMHRLVKITRDQILTEFNQFEGKKHFSVYIKSVSFML